MTSRILPSAERVRELLNYDPETGVFTRRVRTSNSINIGDIAGYVNTRGYISIMVNNRLCLAHRLAWIHVHGTWPLQCLDHIDGDTQNNRIVNMQNRRKSSNGSKSGFLGVSPVSLSTTWQARIKVDGKERYLGCFPTAEEAHAAYLTAKRELHSHCTI